jgi:hypothetical protein
MIYDRNNKCLFPLHSSLTTYTIHKHVSPGTSLPAPQTKASGGILPFIPSKFASAASYPQAFCSRHMIANCSFILVALLNLVMTSARSLVLVFVIVGVGGVITTPLVARERLSSNAPDEK